MLDQFAPHATIAVSDLERAKAWYRDKLGLEPTRLSEGLMSEVVDIAARHRDRCDDSRIVCSSLWVRPQAAE